MESRVGELQSLLDAARKGLPWSPAAHEVRLQSLRIDQPRQRWMQLDALVQQIKELEGGLDGASLQAELQVGAGRC